nr:immunoglobulin light chain junction region [Macaca mulatta]MOV85118.1 immunoglobulin light chain junction region [Macaca mulatta]
CQQDLDWPPTF